MTEECKFPTFYVDDSAVEIGGKRHSVLAAICFANEDEAISRWLLQKSNCGLPPVEEVKWNNQKLTLAQRREFIPILNRGTGIAVIYEGTRQAAAMRLIEQIWSYINSENKQGFRIRFDEGIIDDWNEAQRVASSYFPPCVGLSSHDSRSEQLIQAADFLAGSVKLQVDFGLGRRDRNEKIEFDPEGEMEIGYFFFATLRYCLWGEITDYGDGVNTFEPRKSTLNKGIVIVSSQSREVLEKAILELDGMFMGCIH